MTSSLVGVDVGGTKLSAVRLSGQVWDQPVVTPTDHTSSKRLLDQLESIVGRVRTPDTEGVGIGVPSTVDFANGVVRASVNIPLADVALRTELSQRLGLPVYVDNDANCAALCEASEGDRRVISDLVMFTVGTGVGGGLVLGGRLYRGATGAAGELGHTLIACDLEAGIPNSSRFPQPGSLELLASGRALDLLSRAAKPESALGHRRTEHAVTGADAVDLARAGDAEAKQTVRLIAQRLGVGVANAINTFDPAVVAIGGGLASAGDLLLEPVREVAWRFVLPGVGSATDIRLARSGPEAGVRGAALLAAHERESIGLG
jgi:glucokinase